jgi:hypothetical protein
MQSDSQFFELLSIVKPEPLIHTLENGIEIEKLHLIANPDSEDIKEAIHYSSVVLTFLRLHRLGS